MSDIELGHVIAKLQKIKALHRARAHVRQLELELRGGPARAEEPPFVPEFIRKQVSSGLAARGGVSRHSNPLFPGRPITLEHARETARRA